MPAMMILDWSLAVVAQCAVWSITLVFPTGFSELGLYKFSSAMSKPITNLKCFAGPTVYSPPQILSFFTQLGKLLDIHQTVFFSSFLLAYPDLQLLYFLTGHK